MQRIFLAFTLSLTVVSVCPSAEEKGAEVVPLWQLPPFDRIELINGDLHDIEPTRIPTGTVIEPKPDEYIGQPGLPPYRELKRIAFYRIRLQDDGLEYDVLGKSIKKIQLYEDILLLEAKRLMSEGQADKAFDYLVALTSYAPNWPGVQEARIDFHRAEADRLTAAGDWEKAFWALGEEKRLREDYEKKPSDTPKKDLFGSGTLRDRFDVVTSRWFDQMISERKFDDARKVVSRIEGLFPDSEVAARARRELDRRVTELLSAAKTAETAGDFAGAWRKLEEAEQVLPESPVLRSAIEELHSRFQALNVAVDHLPSYREGLAYWTRADQRTAELLHVPLMRLVVTPEGNRFTSDVIRSIEKGNINKQATLRLAPGLTWPGDGKSVTIVDVQRLLADSCRSNSPLYHPALARLIANLRPILPDQLQLDFDRPQYEPAAWLQMPFLRMGHDAELAKVKSGAALGFSGLGPFRLQQIDTNVCTLGKNTRFLKADHPRLSQVIERQFPESADRLRALERGDVDLVTSIPPRHLAKVATIPGARLIELSRPRVHLVQFNLKRRELRNRTLRRAIDYAIDRQAIFAKVQQPINDKNRIISGPLPFGSFGYNDKIEARPFDRLLAKALIIGVRKEMQTLPPLKLAHSGDETSRAACEAIVENLKAIGLNVTLIDLDSDPSSSARDADLRYQSYVVTDPVYDLITLLTRDNPTLSEHGSPWFRQKVVELVDVPNLSVASQVLPELIRILHEDMILLPLWQWTDHLAVSDAVQGFPDAPGSVYQGIIDWTVTPRFPPSRLSPTVAVEQ